MPGSNLTSAADDAPAVAAPLSLDPGTVAACARQDIAGAVAAELRAHVALIGERARRLAITREYERLLAATEATPDAQE